MISRRTLFGLLAGGSCAAVTPLHAQPMTEWAEPAWDDRARPEGGGVWRVKWFNHQRGFGFIANDSGEEMRVDAAVIRASDIELSEMRPGRTFVVRWKRDERAKIPTALARH